MHGSGLNAPIQPENSREFLDVISPSLLLLVGTIFALCGVLRHRRANNSRRKIIEIWLLTELAETCMDLAHIFGHEYPFLSHYEDCEGFTERIWKFGE
jgi:hypothetical protein